MARTKPDAGFVLPETEPDYERPTRRETAPTRTVPRKASAEAKPRRNVWGQIRFWSGWVLAVVVLLAIIAGLFEFEQFIRHDARFRLISPVDIGDDSPSLKIEGAKYTPRHQLSQLFERDYGRSLYSLPPAERREELLKMPWVKDASVTRVWPNSVAVKIVERVPVAFAAVVGADSVLQTQLIDAEGALLPLPEQATFSLPVITGLKQSDRQDLRADRVKRVIAMAKDLGPLADRVSEVNVTERNNLRATVEMNQRTLVLSIGNRDYRHRLQRFLDSYDDIHRNRPDATRFDIRPENSIVAVTE